MTIVTFSCQSAVHVYQDNSPVRPAFPCKFHADINKAIEHLKKRGVKNPKVITK